MKTNVMFCILALFVCLACSKDKLEPAPKDLTSNVIVGKIKNGTAEQVPFILYPINSTEAELFAYGMTLNIPYTYSNGKFTSNSKVSFLGDLEISATITSTQIQNSIFKASAVESPYTITQAVLVSKSDDNPFRGKIFVSGPLGQYDYIKVRFTNTEVNNYSLSTSKSQLVGPANKYEIFSSVGLKSTDGGNIFYAVYLENKLVASIKIDDKLYLVTFEEEL